MKETKIIKQLTEYNKWRRGDDELKQPNPKDLGVVIEEAIKTIEKHSKGADALREVIKILKL
jgi:hypothetical protein